MNITDEENRKIITEIVTAIKDKGSFGAVHLKDKYETKILKLFAQPSDTVVQLLDEGDNVIFDLLRIMINWYPERERQDFVFARPRRLLQKVLLAANWKVANFLVDFALQYIYKLRANEFWDPQLVHQATPDQWGHAIQLIVKSCVWFNVRQGISVDAVAPQWVEHLGYMKKILEKDYVALSDLVRYPSAFMLMVRLGADLTPKNNGAYTITVPYIVWRSSAKKVQRAHLLQFLFNLDPTLFDVPCGPNNVLLVYEVLRAADLYLLRKLPWLKAQINMNMKDEKGRGIGYYLDQKLIFNNFFDPQDRVLFGSTAVNKRNVPAIIYYLNNDSWSYSPEYYLEHFPEVLQVLQECVRKDKAILLDHLEKTDDLFLLAYCIVNNHKAPQKNLDWNDLCKLWALNGKSKLEITSDTISDPEHEDPDQRCLIHELPDEIFNLIALQISFEDVMNLFAASTTMQQLFKRTNSSFWKGMAAKYFNVHKRNYLAPQPITDWRNHVIKEMKWRSNWMHQRFTERTIFTQLYAGTFFTADDNWLVMTSGLKIFAWNCHTGQLSDMHVLQISVGNVAIVDSTPSTLTVALSGVSWETKNTAIIIADPLAQRVLKQIDAGFSERKALPIFLNYRSKLCCLYPDMLVEVDVEAGEAKILTRIQNFTEIPSAAVNTDTNCMLLNGPSICRRPHMMDADMHIHELQQHQVENLDHVLGRAFKRSSNDLVPSMSMLEFGQWARCIYNNKVHISLIDNQNSRVLIKGGRSGISMLMHPSLKTWYNAWIDSPKKIVAMNSRYLFVYDPIEKCLSCRDFDSTT